MERCYSCTERKAFLHAQKKHAIIQEIYCGRELTLLQQGRLDTYQEDLPSPELT